MNINLQCEELKGSITKVINESGLPISLVYYMMKDLMVELTNVYKVSLEQASQEQKQEENKEEEET